MLHLDYNGFYGSNCTTLSLPALEELGTNCHGTPDECSDGKKGVRGHPGVPNITNFVIETFDPSPDVLSAKSGLDGSPENATGDVSSTKSNEATETEWKEKEQGNEDKKDSATPVSEGGTGGNLESAGAEAKQAAPEVKAVAESVHERLLKQGRSFNIDLYCTGILSNGRLVELLVNSHVHHYLEFKCFDNAYIHTVDGLKEVPCSKKAVFKSSYVSLFEKRHLTRFVKTYVQADPGQPSADLDEEQQKASFSEFLKANKLSEKLRDIILYAIVLADSDQAGDVGIISTKEGLERMRTYMGSLGRYGESPLIYSLFGMSELPQAFSRNSAVKGTIFVLRRGVKRFLLDEETKAIKGVVCSAGQELSAGTVICTKNYWVGKRDLLLSHSRAVVVTDTALVEGKERVIVSLPPSGSSPPVLAYQLDASVSTSPKGTYLVQLVTKAVGPNARSDLAKAVSTLFSTKDSEDATKPTAMYIAYFNLQRYADTAVDSDTLPANLYLCGDTPSQGIELEWEAAVTEAENVFHQICGEEAEFFAETPDPLEEPVDDHVDELIKYAEAIEEHKSAVRSAGSVSVGSVATSAASFTAVAEGKNKEVATETVDGDDRNPRAVEEASPQEDD